MKAVWGFACVMLVVCLVFSSKSASGGLYDDDAKNVKIGDLNSQDYWWSKFNMMMLDLALKQHQPEGKIGLNLVGTINTLNDLAKQYPNHEGIKQWLAHAQEIQNKIDQNAPRNVDWNPDPACPWDESNFAQLWVNLNWAKYCVEQKDWNTARSCLSNVEQNYEFMLKSDRMKYYPEDLRKWVVEHKVEADKLYAEAKARTH